jgi:hypothetical protein
MEWNEYNNDKKITCERKFIAKILILSNKFRGYQPDIIRVGCSI